MDDQYYRKVRASIKLPAIFRKMSSNKPLLITLLVAIPVVGFISFSNRGVLKRMSLEDEREMMRAKVSAAQLEQQKLQKLSDALDNDPKAIEKVAREKYGMVRAGETIYKVKKEK